MNRLLGKKVTCVIPCYLYSIIIDTFLPTVYVGVLLVGEEQSLIDSTS